LFGHLKADTMHERFKRNKAIGGFTIIELVVVITCVGLLAAFAFPRFVMVETEARKALVTSLGSSVNSAATQAHLAWILRDKPATIDMEGQTITMVNGYPNEASIDDTLMDYSGFQFQIAATARFRRQDASQPNTCMVTYAEAIAGSRPAITAFTSGC
jgi:MSHA pilin protein MshA